MHARYYNPLVGRFLSTDKANDWSAASPQSWNRYAYTRNNPLKYVDPDGNAIHLAAGAAAAYAAIETGLSIWDGVETTKIVADPNVSWKSKGLAVGLFGLGLIGPGAGYGLADEAAAGAIGFVRGSARSALDPSRLQHASRHLTQAGILDRWSKATGERFVALATDILERPTRTFDHTLRGGTAARGFVGTIDGRTVVIFVFKEGPNQGKIATAVAPSARQLGFWLKK